MRPEDAEDLMAWWKAWDRSLSKHKHLEHPEDADSGGVGAYEAARDLKVFRTYAELRHEREWRSVWNDYFFGGPGSGA
jgi:hypothetical protein